MAQTYDTITDKLRQFILEQQLFFVGSAPLTGDGHVNISPKGLDTFRLLTPNQVCYLDLTGSGNETSAHLAENGRITFMFCAFAGPPSILRLYGRGRVALPDSPEWAALRPQFGEYAGARQIIIADIQQVQTSCGFAVPFYEFKGNRDTLHRWTEAKGPAGLITYQREKNATSLDGLPTPMGTAFATAPAED